MANNSMGLPSQKEAMSFVNKYHADTIKLRKAYRHEDGRVTTVNAIGLHHEGKIYTVPGYDRNTGKIYSEKDEDGLKKLWLKDIKAGNIVGIPVGEEGRNSETGEHYSNIYAKRNHKSLEGSKARKESLGAVSFDYDFFDDQSAKSTRMGRLK